MRVTAQCSSCSGTGAQFRPFHSAVYSGNIKCDVCGGSGEVPTPLLCFQDGWYIWIYNADSGAVYEFMTELWPEHGSPDLSGPIEEWPVDPATDWPAVRRRAVREACTVGKPARCIVRRGLIAARDFLDEMEATPGGH